MKVKLAWENAQDHSKMSSVIHRKLYFTEVVINILVICNSFNYTHYFFKFCPFMDIKENMVEHDGRLCHPGMLLHKESESEDFPKSWSTCTACML